MRKRINIIESQWAEWESEKQHDEMYQTFDFRLDDVFWSEANDRT